VAQASALFYGNPAMTELVESNKVNVREGIDQLAALLKYIDFTRDAIGNI
jgi:hypothetical protein